MGSVALAVMDGITLLEVAAPCDVFGVDRPALADPWYDFIVCGPGTATIGRWFRPNGIYGWDQLTAVDTVIVPACPRVDERPPDGMIDAIRAAHECGARVASICTGAFVLAAAGLLDGRRATTHWKYTELFRRQYPRVHLDPDVLYIDEGTVLTSAGKGAGIDLCLHIVRLDHGVAVANALARLLVMPPHRDGGQAQFIPAPPSDGKDHVLAALLPWAASHLDQPLTVRDLALQANMSPRNLTRHFNHVVGMTPLRWLLAHRTRRAQELLETTDDSVELVATNAGFGTATTLRRHFHRMIGVTPDAYRRTFRGRQPHSMASTRTG